MIKYFSLLLNLSFIFLCFFIRTNEIRAQITKELVGKIKDDVYINMYFTDNLEYPYDSLKYKVSKILDDYEKLSNGKIKIIKDKDKSNETLIEEAKKSGIKAIEFLTLKNDKYVIRDIVLGLNFLYKGKQLVIPLIEKPDNLRYEINKVLYYFTLGKKINVGYLKGHGEFKFEKFSLLQNTLSEYYNFISIDLENNSELFEDLDVLLIIAPEKPFPESHKYLIDQFIMRGGNVAWLINKVTSNIQQQIIIGNLVETNLDDMLSNYGIVIKNDLIRDRKCSKVQVETQDGSLETLNYPFFPDITNIDNENPVFKNIKSVITLFVSSLDLSAAYFKEINVKPLLTTSDNSGKVEHFFILNLEQFQNLTERAMDTLFASKGFVVGALYTGKFNSFYAGKEIPKGIPSNNIQYIEKKLDNSIKESKMVVVGDGDFVNEESKPPKENIEFFKNIIEYLGIDKNLVDDLENK